MANNYTSATVTPDMPKTAFTEGELKLLSGACGLTCEESDGHLYFFAEDWFADKGEDAEGKSVICTAMLQEKLKGLEPADFPHIIIEAACYCSKMRPGEFGGFAYFITREEVRYISTWSWLHEMETTKRNAVESGMTNPTDSKPLDSFDYCLDFWDGALDPQDEIDHLIREASPRHVRACDDVA